MSTLKISYNGSEISSVDATSPVSVAYNNSTIATLNDGDTKTLGCNGKVMASDVVVGGKTLNCSGKLMQGDIVVELVGSTASGEMWYFNDTIGYIVSPLVVNFISNGVAYNGILRIKAGRFIDDMSYQYGTSNQSAYNYRKSKWYDEAYRTIVLDEHATGDFLEYLEANATKIS